ARIADFAPDFGAVLDELAQSLHRVQLLQLVPGYAMTDQGGELDALAGAIAPDLVQLWYQMALHGRRDLPLAPSPRIGFEMALLRMLAFRPAGAPGEASRAGAATAAATPDASAGRMAEAPRPDGAAPVAAWNQVAAIL